MERGESLCQKKGKMKKLLTEAIALLCRNSLSFGEELTVEGLIGITIDKQVVLLINMNETLHGNEAASWPNYPSHGEDKLDSLSYKTASMLEREIMGKAKSDAPGSSCPKEASLKKDLQGFDIHSTACKDVPVKQEESHASSTVPRRKQRKPVQIKEEPEALVIDDMDDSDIWESYSTSGNQNKTDKSTESKASAKKTNYVTKDVQEPEFVMLENDSGLEMSERKVSPGLDLTVNTSQHGYPGGPLPIPPLAPLVNHYNRYSENELGKIVSLKTEGAILSVPSPQSIYNSVRGGGGGLASQQDNVPGPSPQAPNSAVPSRQVTNPHASVYASERELLSENESIEAKCSLPMSGEQIYSGGITELAELPMDLSVDAKTHQLQQHATSTPIPHHTGGRRRRSRFSYSSPGKEIVNALGAVRCPVCRKWFDSRIKYNRHKRSHRGIFTCKVCGRAYNRKDNMQRHHKLYHSAYGELSIDDSYTHSTLPPTQPDNDEAYSHSQGSGDNMDGYLANTLPASQPTDNSYTHSTTQPDNDEAYGQGQGSGDKMDSYLPATQPADGNDDSGYLHNQESGDTTDSYTQNQASAPQASAQTDYLPAEVETSPSI